MRLLATLVLTTVGLSTIAQSAAQYLARGDKEMNDGYPKSALYYYELAAKADSLEAESYYAQGKAHAALRAYAKAEKAFRKTQDLDGKDQFLDAIVYLAMAQKQQGRYADAIKNLKYFSSVYKSRDALYRLARRELESCEWAAANAQRKPRFAVDSAALPFNTEHSEMAPFFFDSASLWFASMRYTSEREGDGPAPLVRPFLSKADTNGWQPAETVVMDGTEGSHLGNFCYTADTATLFFSLCPTLDACTIYSANRSGSGWTAPVPLPEPVNVGNSSNTQPHVARSGDEEFLLFASNRESGKGGMDIWFTTLKNNAPTSRIRNAGPKVNTEGDEITPWYDADSATLYFSSNAHPGFGGFDVIATTGTLGNFNPPQNAGTGINSPADDYYFALRSAQNLGYLATNRPGGAAKAGDETCCNDLLRVSRVVRKDTVPANVVADTAVADTLEIDSLSAVAAVPTTFEELQASLPLSLYFHNDRPDPRTTRTTTDKTYEQCVLEYLSLQSEYVTAANNSGASGIVVDSLRAAANAFFTSELESSLNRLETALKLLLAELERGNNIALAVKGFASPLADSDYNLNLTLRRIVSMENQFRSYANGAFNPYLDGTAANGATLSIERIPYGESQSAAAVSDNLSDRFGAIYSPRAVAERRIEILRIDKN